MFKLRQFLPLCTSCFKRSQHKTIFNTKNFSTQSTQTPKEKIEYDDGPIKYSTSKASKYKAKMTRTGIEEERLWYESYVIMASVGIFLLYFCVLRQENDIDKDLNISLYSRIEGLEEYQLKLSLNYNLEKGLDTKDIVHRLQEIEQEKEKARAASSE